MSALPPTKPAFQQHIRKAELQRGRYWGYATMPYRQLPSPSEWWWTCPEQRRSLWTNLPEESASCPGLLKCQCTVGAGA